MVFSSAGSRQSRQDRFHGSEDLTLLLRSHGPGPRQQQRLSACLNLHAEGALLLECQPMIAPYGCQQSQEALAYVPECKTCPLSPWANMLCRKAGPSTTWHAGQSFCLLMCLSCSCTGILWLPSSLLFVRGREKRFTQGPNHLADLWPLAFPLSSCAMVPSFCGLPSGINPGLAWMDGLELLLCRQDQMLQPIVIRPFRTLIYFRMALPSFARVQGSPWRKCIQTAGSTPLAPWATGRGPTPPRTKCTPDILHALTMRSEVIPTPGAYASPFTTRPAVAFPAARTCAAHRQNSTLSLL